MTTKKSPFLSKTKYLEGLKCHKLLWYEYNKKDAFPPVDPADQAKMDQGKAVGELAHTLFPGGMLLERVCPLEAGGEVIGSRRAS